MASELPTLRAERISLRPATTDDLPALAAMLAEPAVARWWGEPYTASDVAEELAYSLAILIDDSVAGWLQVTEETDPDYRSVAFDISLATRFHGQGYGREALRLAIDHYAAAGHHRFTIDPAAANERAIRSYAAVGFKPVGLMREYERGADGSWHDNLLMDLLARELD